MKEPGLFDMDERLSDISSLKDPLEVLKARIPWEMFRPLLQKAFEKERKGPQGRKAFDCVFMFKCLILQSLYGLSDHQTEYQIKDRLSFMRFLDLIPADAVPDEKTLWLFRENLKTTIGIKPLFDRFNTFLKEAGFRASQGTIVDASLIEVPRMRNTRSENEKLKEGEVPESMKENPRSLRQKDLDARWTKKRQETYFGYKNHIRVDKESKLIEEYRVSDAALHDSQQLEALLDLEGPRREVYGDSAYNSEEARIILEDYEHSPLFCEKGQRGRPLTKTQKRENRKKSRVRARVEHVFGWQYWRVRGGLIRGIGKARIGMKIGLLNLCYNLSRFCYLKGVAV